MPVQTTTRTKIVASLTVAQDGSMVTYISGGKTFRRSFGTADRAVVAFLIGSASSGTVSALTVSDIGGGHAIELVKSGGARFTTSMGRDERELADFLTA